MATNKGSSGVVKIAANGGSVAAVGEVRSYSIDETADTIEDTSMGDTVKTYLSSLTDATLTVDALWDDGDAQQLILEKRVGSYVFPEGWYGREVLLRRWCCNC